MEVRSRRSIVALGRASRDISPLFPAVCRAVSSLSKIGNTSAGQKRNPRYNGKPGKNFNFQTAERWTKKYGPFIRYSI